MAETNVAGEAGERRAEAPPIAPQANDAFTRMAERLSCGACGGDGGFNEAGPNTCEACGGSGDEVDRLEREVARLEREVERLRRFEALGSYHAELLARLEEGVSKRAEYAAVRLGRLTNAAADVAPLRAQLEAERRRADAAIDLAAGTVAEVEAVIARVEALAKTAELVPDGAIATFARLFCADLRMSLGALSAAGVGRRRERTIDRVERALAALNETTRRNVDVDECAAGALGGRAAMGDVHVDGPEAHVDIAAAELERAGVPFERLSGELLLVRAGGGG